MAAGRTDGSRSGTGRRRGGGPRALAASLPKVAGKAFGRRGLAQGGLVADWPSIVGADLAAVSLPRGLSRGGDGGTLTLRVEPAQALVLQHLEPLVIERVNGYLGYRAVARLRLQQGPLGARRAPDRPPPPPLTAEQEARLRAQTATVGDAALRGALEKLGRAVRQKGARSVES
jgi:hypothetical protein